MVRELLVAGQKAGLGDHSYALTGPSRSGIPRDMPPTCGFPAKQNTAEVQPMASGSAKNTAHVEHLASHLEGGQEISLAKGTARER